MARIEPGSPAAGRRALLARRIVAALATLLLLVGAAGWFVMRPPDQIADEPLVVNDITRLNPIRVSQVITPERIDDIVTVVAQTPGPISIGGARHSMGGQIATDGGVHLDMRRFNRVLAYEPAEKRITVESGATWRQIQEQIDRDDLSVAIMQSYADFTVGGSLSVNVHGRYVGAGPIISSVLGFHLVLADGRVVEASPSVNPQIFYGAIGGYGGLGVITDVTLRLVDNVRVARRDISLPASEYRRYFFEQVASDRNAVFHNGDLYPDGYDSVHAVTYTKTGDAVTVGDRLVRDVVYAQNRLAYWIVSTWPAGKMMRQFVLDPLVFDRRRVTWRNYEASYAAAELEPASRAGSTYVLQEYFVPETAFDAFVPRMRAILQRYRVNVINVSIRHATADPGALLAWARTDVCSFVVYYKQGTSEADRVRVGEWTRALIDAALDLNGSYYLPYQLHATAAQFRRAYPRAGEFFALKRRLDPLNKFRNRLWDAYDEANGPSRLSAPAR